jgi:flagellar motor switch protein FliM
LQPNGIPAFDVSIGTVGAQVAVQIERAVAPGGQ